MIIIIISYSHRCCLSWKQQYFVLLVWNRPETLDVKDLSFPRSADFRKVLTLTGIPISFKAPFKFFGITPRCPTTTSIAFVFAL